jgi:phage tail-like protein
MKQAPTRDANNATWYVLRYARDFVPAGADPLAPWKYPVPSKELFYDAGRHVLELLPKKPDTEAELLPGIAVDVDGQIYTVDPKTGAILVRRCDGSVVELVCERDIFARPAGLALDRRGFLYVADPMAGRVVVVLPDDGTVVGVLVDGLMEPVDVAVAPDGRIYVADRAVGLIVRFHPNFQRCGDFPPKYGEELPVPPNPRPIAVMIDADGAILVADANYPRLLRFAPDGKRLSDAELHSLVQMLEGGTVALKALEKAYGKSMPRFFSGSCGPCRPEHDGGERLAEVHRAIRLLLLRLPHTFEDCGTFVSAAFDAGTPGVTWHKITIDADLPPGTWLKIQTVTSDRVDDLANPSALPPGIAFAPFEDVSSCAVKPIAPSNIPDRLVFSPPGRYLRLRLVLGSDGTATPSIRAVRVFHPRVSYLDLLPRVFRRDPESALFLEHFLALFEHVFTDVEDRYELFSRELDPAAAPSDVLDWLASLIDLSFDPSWPIERRRALVAVAVDLYKIRGTVRGIERYVEIYTGIKPIVLEGFLERPHMPPFLGLPGNVLGCATGLASTVLRRTPEDMSLLGAAHRFTVLVPLPDACDEKVLLSVVNRIVEANKPAHTVHTLHALPLDARVGHSRVGLDLVLGGREAPRTMLGGCPLPGAPTRGAGILGVDSVLGEKRPEYARSLSATL